MKTGSNQHKSEFIVLQGKEWLEKQRIAGKVVAGALSLLEALVKERTTKSLIELNQIAEDHITSNNCSCTFKGYQGFPAGVCISIDGEKSNTMVHGIPTDYRLEAGDIVKFDLGATFYGDNDQGAIADSAISCIFGEPKDEKHIELLKDTRDALMKGISSIKVGNRLGCIGDAIYKHGNDRGYGVIENYGGHSINWNTAHAKPFIPNKANVSEGIRIQNGFVGAIEPMFCLGGTKTYVAENGWDVCTEKGIISSHWEHSIYVHEDRVEIITLREGEIV